MSNNMIRLIAVGAILVSTSCANIISPAQGEIWALNVDHEITWDTEGLVAPLQVQLGPGDSNNASSSITTVAPSVPNTGRWVWQPTTSIPQHQNFQIIIIDNGGRHQRSPPFQMIGWPQQPPSHVQPPAHVQPPPPPHQLPPVHTPLAPPHVMPPPAQVAPPMHTTPPSHVAPGQPSAILVTSLIVQTLIHTSQPAPIIKTIESPPLVQTENIAPIIVTQHQQPVTKVQTRPDQIMTEIGMPIVKTILVTETPAPIIKTLTQEPITMVESQAPILLTQTQAPLIKTLSQPPKLVTEHLAPVLMTSEITQTIHLTSFIHPSMAPPAHTMAPPAHVVPPPAHVIISQPAHVVAPPIQTPAVPIHQVSSPVAGHLQPSVLTPLVPAHTSGAVQNFPNTTLITSSTAVEIPAFTTPIRLGATAPGSASGTPVPSFSFVGAAPKNSVVIPCVFSLLAVVISALM